MHKKMNCHEQKAKTTDFIALDPYADVLVHRVKTGRSHSKSSVVTLSFLVVHLSSAVPPFEYKQELISI